ncbi:peptidyl-prolyl cis-trans isomerase, EpsD family [Duganella sp. OV458]|nr:peptidyl-prolyl cis-trans isomerase, EpsD family [Duganella sp. OV458]SDK52201.1 peptidyl-prolyl cis-trans isomerase, EpsD family [Duganella sp. OV510]
MAVLALSACGEKEKKPGQALASVNGEEITISQLNEEMQRANIQVAQQEQASKQLLAALVDRQLLQSEASKEKIDRDPKVMQAIERAKALIIAQAYLQKKVGNITKPSSAEVEQYFSKHPEFFSQRKQFDMRQLVLASKDLTPELTAAIDAAKSLEDVASWLDSHKVKYARAQLSRTSSDLPPELSGKLSSMPKGQLFIVKEGERSILMTLVDVKEAPVTLEVAAPQIEQALMSQRSKAASEAELSRLRADAKIVYFNKVTGAAEPVKPADAAPADGKTATERGVAGLK